MLQLAVAAGSIGLALGRNTASKPDWWAFAIVGLVLIILGLVMERIRQGITRNNIVLKKVGAEIGDEGIPAPGSWASSYSAWVAYAMIALGCVSILLSIVIGQPITDK